MKLYLARHAEASPHEIDSECPLSDKGEEDLQKMVGFLAPQKLQVDFFFHSGKLRAMQTAQALEQAIHCERGVEAKTGLNPLDLVSPIASEINQADQDMALVGHMPFMGKLLSKLMTGYENSDLIVFQTATLVCLERLEGGSWVVKWTLCPELFSHD